jgi:hypothetical protein
MTIVKCASCGAVMEAIGEEATDRDEITQSLCPLCKVEVHPERETDFLIVVEEDDPGSR